MERETHAIEEAERSSFSATQVLREVAQARTDKHRRTSTLLHTRENLVAYHSKHKDLYEKKKTYENERISIKNSLPYIKCVLRLSCVVHGPIYGRLMGCTVNGFLSI